MKPPTAQLSIPPCLWSPTGRRQRALAALVSLLALSACMAPSRPPPPPDEPARAHPETEPPRVTEPEVRPLPPRARPAPPEAGVASSAARSAREYRLDAARHLYAQYPTRIHLGRLPPLLQAVGVLNVHIDRQGQVRELDWLRAPRHVPEVQQDIERLVRAAAPYPVPRHLGSVIYTDTWLWVRGGRFQLDTLTEGQR